MEKELPNFKTVFKDILLPKKKASVTEQTKASGRETREVKKSESIKRFGKVAPPAKKGEFKFIVNNQPMTVPPLSLTMNLKDGPCRVCGDLKYHYKFDMCPDHPPTEVIRPKRSEILKQCKLVIKNFDPDDDESDYEEDEEINRLFELSKTFVPNRSRNVGCRALNKPALQACLPAYTEHKIKSKDEMNELPANPAPEAVGWEKELGFKKGPKKQPTNYDVTYSESWDLSENWNLYGAVPKKPQVKNKRSPKK